jgi:hypothetical protein
MLRFGVGPIAVAGKTPPITSELVLQEGDVIDIQGLLGYLVCDNKKNYVVYLVLGREDDTISKSYEPSGSLPIKEESIIKKKSKRPLPKKVKQEPKIKVRLYIYILI